MTGPYHPIPKARNPALRNKFQHFRRVQYVVPVKKGIAHIEQLSNAIRSYRHLLGENVDLTVPRVISYTVVIVIAKIEQSVAFHRVSSIGESPCIEIPER